MTNVAFIPQSQVGNFEITRVLNLGELQCTLIEARHRITGSEVIHLACDDEENLFCLSFRTYPDQSDGVAHILEHTVLCGSKKFPVRDPFFYMTRRSLNTFMNALTGADFTCYPAASCIPKDFYNLLDVYLDAVFHPLLSNLSFLQEGHRLEFEKKDDPTTPLCFKGIVFNEMKGALHSSDTRLLVAIMHSLFPDLTYGVNSGGDPKHIPDLTYEKLKAFHQAFYHPSRALFFFYGNLPLEKHLTFIEDKVLRGVEKIPPLPPLPKQKRFLQPVRKTEYYPISESEPENEKGIIALTWLTCSILDQLEVLALAVIDLVLMGTDAAALKNAFLQSKLCKTADSMLETELSEIPYAFILKGCEEKNKDAIESILRTELAKIAKEGLPKYLVDGAIHQLEFVRSEITGDSHPYGLSLFMRSALLKLHGGNPEDGLLIHSLFKKLRDKCEDPTFLPKIIEKHLLNNPHFVCITLLPSRTLAKQEKEEEKSKLESIKKSLSIEEKKKLVIQAQSLAAEQEKGEDKSNLLPKLSLDDVPRKAKDLLLEEEIAGNLKIFRHTCFTNQIVYASIFFDLPSISEEELILFKLFSSLLTHMGCGGRSYKETLEQMLMHTGGIGSGIDLCTQAHDPSLMRPCLILKGKALVRKMDHLFSLFTDFIENTDFTDKDRLSDLLMQHFHELEESAHRGNLRYAINLAGSGLSVPARITNQWYGLDYYHAMKKIKANFEQNPSQLIGMLQEFSHRCLGLKGAHLVLSCDEKTYAALKQNNFYGLATVSSKPFIPWKADLTLEKVCSQARMTASPVAMTSWLFKAPHYAHPDAPALYVASEIMENTTLHKRIREQGGAYGSGAVSGALSGCFYFYAYRDPHLASTLDAIAESVENLSKGKFQESDIEEAKLGVFQELDSPIPPKSRATVAYNRLRTGRTVELRQGFRDRLFALTKEQIVHASKIHLAAGIKNGVIVTFAGKELLERENSFLKEKALPIYPID